MPKPLYRQMWMVPRNIRPKLSHEDGMQHIPA